MSDDPFDLATVEQDDRGGAVAPYLFDLNPAQREAVDWLDGPLLVLAGAGTGKTRVLITRLAHLIHQRKAFPSQILAVTFTNKAAKEMHERVAAMVGRAVEGIWLGTFHAICVRILRRHAELAGLKSNFTILDTDDQLRLLKQVLEEADLDTKRWPPRGLLAVIDHWKNRGLAPDKIDAGEAQRFADGRAGTLYKRYQERLGDLNAADFGDLLLHVLALLSTNADIARHYQEQFRYILVDEYQDTNVAQYLLLRLLARGHGNICCVGDDDQSIYSWRGAEVGNILRFEKDFPGAKIVRLEQNYRSTPHILAAASGLIAQNTSRHGKTLWTEVNGGDKVVVRGLWGGQEEARFISEEAEALADKGKPLSEIAILVRAGFQTREFEERFIAIGMPYRLVGATKFYERAHIRDAMAYCRVVAQPADDLAFERIVNKPKRALGAKSVQTIHQIARAERQPMTRAAQVLCETDDLPAKGRRSLADLMLSFERWRAALETTPHAEVLETILEESGYVEMLQKDRSPAAPGRLEDLKELVRALYEFETLPAFLEHVALVMDTDAMAGEVAINLMTLHAAKGLEFDVVFLPGWEEGLFPHQRALDEGGNASLEEERRLAYVGLTRARQKATVCYAANRRMFDRWVAALPSRFVAELPDDHVVREVDTGLTTGMAYPGHGAAAFSPPSFARPYRANPAPLYLDGQAEYMVTDNPDAARHEVGGRIFHQKFGYGRVLAVEGNKLEIDFEKAGRKRVVASFVEQA